MTSLEAQVLLGWPPLTIPQLPGRMRLESSGPLPAPKLLPLHGDSTGKYLAGCLAHVSLLAAAGLMAAGREEGVIEWGDGEVGSLREVRTVDKS